MTHPHRSPSRRPALLPWLALAAVLLAACTNPDASASERVQPSPRPQDTAVGKPGGQESAALTAEQALASFDDAWATIRDTHYDPDLNGLDWNAVRDELRPRAEHARSRAELREVISEMAQRLGQSHFAVIPADALPEGGTPAMDESGGLGFDVRLREGRVLVCELDPGGPVEAAGVRLGWSLTFIGGLSVEETLARMQAAATALGPRQVAFRMWAVVHARIVGAPGESVELRFRDDREQEQTFELRRTPRDVVAHNFGNQLSTFFLEFRSRVLEREGKRIGELHFSNWFLPMMKPLDAAMDDLRGTDGIVIDLRGNTGGAAGMIMGVSGHFFDQSTRLGVMTTRDSSVNVLALPRKVNAAGELVQPFAGPLAILIDETSASASEIFAGGMQDAGRARVFGETSAGAALPATTTQLPNGDSLMHATGDFVTSTGTRLEGRGVVPDEVVPLRRADLLAGRDPQLEAALTWILSQAR